MSIMTQTDHTNETYPTLERAIDRYLDTVQKGDESGNYRRNAERHLLNDWLPWARARGARTPADVDRALMLEWAERLKTRVDKRRSDSDDEAGIAPGTASTYHDFVRAFVTFCIERDLHPAAPAQNPAALDPVEDLIPDRQRQHSDEQFWTDDARVRFIRYVDKQAHDRADEVGLDAYQAFRDRALVYVLAFTGVRIGEITRSSHDDRRNGLRWGDVTDDPPSLVVLGKSQRIEEAPLPDQAKDALDRLRRVARPPSDEWPVFATTHAPTYYRLARENLTDHDHTQAEVDDLCSHANIPALLDALRECDIAPPAVTADGVRKRLKTLCDRAELDVDDDHGYLTPHGGRRGVGSTLYFDNPAKAQKALRHSSMDVTEQAYSHLDTGQLGEDMTSLFANESDDSTK